MSKSGIHAWVDLRTMGFFSLCIKAEFPQFQHADESVSITAFVNDNNTIVTDATTITHPAYVVSSYIDKYKEQEVDIAYDKDKAYNQLVFHVFAKYASNEAGAWNGVHPLGFAFMDLQSIQPEAVYTIQVKSVVNTIVGTLCVSLVDTSNTEGARLPSITPVLASVARNKSVAQCKRLIENAYRSIATTKYNPLWGEHPPKFVEVSLRGEQLPILVVLSSMSNIKADPVKCEQLLLWWLKIASSNRGTSLVQTRTSQTVLQSMELIAEMLTLCIKGLRYSHDSIRKRGGGYHSEDMWNSIFIFPPSQLNDSVYDCEDGMITVSELVNLVRNAAFESKDLQYAQQLLREYAVVSVLGQIKTGVQSDGKTPLYVCHAFPLLIDKRWLSSSSSSSSQAGNKFLDTIVMETTNYIAYDFLKKSINDVVSDDLYDKLDSVTDKLVKGEDAHPKEAMHWRYITHLQGPAHRVVSEKVYGMIHSIYTRDGPSGEITHYHAVDVKNGWVGINALDLFETKSQEGLIRFDKVFSVSSTDLQLVSAFTSENCPLALPRLPTEQEMQVVIPSLDTRTHRRYIIKAVNQQVVDQFIACVKKRNKEVIQTRVTLFEKCPMVFVDVPTE